MGNKTIFRLLLAVSILALFGLSCSLVSQVGGIKSTVQAGQELLQTGQAVVTEAQVGSLVQTAQAIATQVDESGVKETMQAAATKVEESGAQETIQAAATQIDESGLQETAQAVITQVILSPDQAPPDIPLFEGEKNAFVGSPQLISYFVNADLKPVLDFYQTQMPLNGWMKVDYGTVVTDVSATLYYEKEGRKATVVITVVPILNQTTVVITLE